MTAILYTLLAAVSAAIAVLHALSVFGQSRTARISAYACIALHVVLFADMLLLALPMDTAVLIFLASVLWYSALSALRYARDKKSAASSEEVKNK